ncbi:MAG: hypothetical protein HY959_06325 [Ignavibacteriae bacterium]|nr:hypothetical protein [Ignavibacteriota bacterium]
MKIDYLQCNTCTRLLIKNASERSQLFRYTRNILKYVMRIWVILRRIDLSNYIIKSPYCKNCNRVYKNALKDNSKVFLKFNNIINPYFDSYIEKKLGKSNIAEAKIKARELKQLKEIYESVNINTDITKWTKI